MLATSRSCGNMLYFDQNYLPGKITILVSVLIIKYLVAVFFGKGNSCCIFGFNCCLEESEKEKSGMHERQKDSSFKKRVVDSELKNFLVKRFYRQCLEKYLDRL